jgi:hypothetical protein
MATWLFIQSARGSCLTLGVKLSQTLETYPVSGSSPHLRLPAALRGGVSFENLLERPSMAKAPTSITVRKTIMLGCAVYHRFILCNVNDGASLISSSGA